ncbi:MAG: hypothetical protein AAGB16_01120 [Pseudomonadota bacterium]
MTMPMDDNAAYLWSIIIMGVALPIILGVYVTIRTRLNKARLERMREGNKG